MGLALSKLAQEDPSFKVATDQESNQTIISGMGELHLEIIVDRLKENFLLKQMLESHKLHIEKLLEHLLNKKQNILNKVVVEVNMVMFGSN